MPRHPEKPALAIVGVTGLVGRELLEILSQHEMGRGEIRLFASNRTAGATVEVRDRRLPVHALTTDGLAGIDLAFFCAGSSVSTRFAPVAVDQGAVVIDNSSAYRMQAGVPLVIPEINGAILEGFAPRAPGSTGTAGIIANPNCSTIIAAMVTTPLHRAVGIERMIISTYQAGSGAGAAVVGELEQQAREFAAGRPYTTDVVGRQYLFNVFCHDSPIGPDGYNEEERKVDRELKKIWDDDSVRITATCVRVPVLRAHCEAINLTLRRPLDEPEARRLLAESPGVTVVDDRPSNKFPEPIDATGLDEVLVGRIRADLSQPPGRGLHLFVAGDQLRKGAALNAVQIAERLVLSRAESAV
ncbi:MAG: aspartate-semialdehyde dehydrogenase [Planctomycetota bacterium]